MCCVGKSVLRSGKRPGRIAMFNGSSRYGCKFSWEMGMLIRAATLVLMLGLTLSACTTTTDTKPDRNPDLTQGNVQMNIVVGQTTKAEVLEVFGAPNITTRDGSGREVWSYQRQAQVARSSQESGYGTLILIGGSSRSSGFETSSRMMTLIVKFDATDVVADFSSRTSNF